MDQPPWLTAAWAEFGVREIPGDRDAPEIIRYFREAGDASVSEDETPWCAAFAGSMLRRGGIPGTGSLLARSYLKWGSDIEEPRLGAIAVFSRGADPVLGHVGFYLGESKNKIFVLGGNQGNSVSVAACERTRLLGFRWPVEAFDEVPAPATDEAIFDKALAHVLEMEGGYSNDPYDPGGPTNKGVTLDVFARFKGVSVDAGSRLGLINELRRIPDDAVKAIYRKRYWEPSNSPAFAGALALMHFDAAVNHGVGGAIRMLQQVAGVTVDGEIGPETLSAIGGRSAVDLVESYAEVRRARYRALPHFWRFGRGWLRRVDATLALAREWIGPDGLARGLIEPSQVAKGETEMTNDSQVTPVVPVDGQKWWAQSKTIWGTLITAAATVIPVLGPLIGITLPGDVITDLGNQTVSAVQAIVGLFGTLLAIYGRVKAAEPIGGRKIKLKI